MPRFPSSACALLSIGALLCGCAGNSLYSSNSEDIREIASANSGVQSSGAQKHFLGLTIPYRIDVQQGNFVSREMVAQIKDKMKSPEGMTQEQVRFVMGTPLLEDAFHKDRWDYVFRLQKSDGDVLSSHVTVFFKDGKVASLEGGDLPTENDYLSLIAGKTPPKSASAESAKKE